MVMTVSSGQYRRRRIYCDVSLVGAWSGWERDLSMSRHSDSGEQYVALLKAYREFYKILDHVL